MYRFFLLLISAMALNHFVYANEQYTVNPDSSKLEWEGRKVTGEHYGVIDLESGFLVFENSRLKGGEFSIDMNSIVNIDLEDESWNKKLIDHLKSDDFFSVEKFPLAKFKITDVKNYRDSNTDANYLIIGDLTIKGITHSIEFPAVVTVENGMIAAKAKMEVDRSKFDVRYGSGSFFKGLGDKMIYDNFTMMVSLSASK